VSAPKSTPGPWEVVPAPENGGWLLLIRSQTFLDVCTVDGAETDGLNEANARLIAAAPDLYEIVERYVARDGASGEVDTELHRDARAVLAKAEGK